MRIAWRWVSAFQFLNRYLLTYFFLQGVTIMVPLRLWSHYGGYRDQWELCETKPVRPWVAVLLSYLFIAVLAPLFKFWESRFHSVGTLEWVVRAISDPPEREKAKKND